MASANEWRIDVLINSPGPHDQVRIRLPYHTLQQLGVDCRLHERPFHFNSCIRPNSLVIWQRPLPDAAHRMREHLQWLRQRGCLLLVDWDDHPDLFPDRIRQRLSAMAMAPLVYCHGILTSNPQLARALHNYNPLTLCLDNYIGLAPSLNLKKHRGAAKPTRVFIGNLNRQQDHQQLVHALRLWLEEDARIQLVIVGDSGLAQQLPAARTDCHSMLAYAAYRQVLQSCHLALLPLSNSAAHACKTVIKWQECAAESVAVVGGPALYGGCVGPEGGYWVTDLGSIVPRARELADRLDLRLQLVAQAHAMLRQGWDPKTQLEWHAWLLHHLWLRRQRLDAFTSKRLQLGDSTR